MGSPRYKLGPQIADAKLRRNPSAPAPASPDAPHAVVKEDVEIKYLSHDAYGSVVFDVPAYDLATHHKLVALHTVFVPSGHGLFTDGDAAMASPYAKASLDVSQHQGGVAATVPSPDGLPDQDADFVIQAVLEFEPLS